MSDNWDKDCNSHSACGEQSLADFFALQNISALMLRNSVLSLAVKMLGIFTFSFTYSQETAVGPIII